MKLSWRLIKRLSVFDWLAVLVVLLGAVFLIVSLFKQEKWVKVEVKVAPEAWWWNAENPPNWLVDRIQLGEEQYDSLGRKIAEVLDVKVYEYRDERKIAYLSLDLKVEVDKKRKQYKFNHGPLEVGQLIDLEFGHFGMPALVTDIEGMADTRIWEDKVVETRLINFSDIFPETLGVYPWLAEEVKVGDKMVDTQGRIVAEVLAKQVRPADKVVGTAFGQAYLAKDPILKDVVLTLRLKTFKQAGVNYFLDDMKVKVGGGLIIALPEVDIYPHITKIVE